MNGASGHEIAKFVRIARENKLEIVTNNGNDVVFDYTFKDKRILHEACTVPFSPPGQRPQEMPYNNQRLALLGDGGITDIMRKHFAISRRPIQIYLQIYQHGMQTNAYMAHIAESRGLIHNCMMRNGCAVENKDLTQHEKGDCFEAIIGAVYEDSGFDQKIVEDMMLHMGIFWPYQLEAEKAVLDMLAKKRKDGII